MGANLDSGRKSRGGLTPNINVTPLVDVVLVLLIIFMVVIPNVQDGKPIEMLKVDNLPEQPADLEPIVVTIDAEEIFTLDTDDLPRATVLALVQQQHAEEPRRPILIRGDARLRYAVIREFFAELQGLGVGNIKLAVGTARQWSEDETPPEGAG